MTTCGRVSFSGPREISTTADEAQAVYAGDLDGDQDVDVLSASYWDSKIALYENLGGRFRTNVISSTADGATSVITADIDGDNDLDVLSTSIGDDTVRWFENDGYASFETHLITTSADGAASVATGDLDGDSQIDVVSASDHDDTIAWYSNDHKNFTKHIISTTARGAWAVAVADLDGDQDLDVISVSLQDDTVAWYENHIGSDLLRKQIAFQKRIITTTATIPRGLAVGDLDNDGDLDIATAEQLENQVAWYESDGAIVPSFKKHIITQTTDAAWSVHIADVDGDHSNDVISASYWDDKISWFHNDGHGVFTSNIISTTANGATSVFAADIDSDLDLDILSASSLDNTIAWYVRLFFKFISYCRYDNECDPSVDDEIGERNPFYPTSRILEISFCVPVSFIIYFVISRCWIVRRRRRRRTRGIHLRAAPEASAEIFLPQSLAQIEIGEQTTTTNSDDLLPTARPVHVTVCNQSVYIPLV